MRWKRKQWPKEGDKRITKRFLLFPRVLGDEWRWLEIAQIHQEYRPVRWMMDVPTLRDWVDLRWAE